MLAELTPWQATRQDAGRFIESGYWAVPGAVRDTDDRDDSCILDRDLPAAVELHRDKRPLDGLLLNIPKKFALPCNLPALPRYLKVAPSQRYDTAIGFITTQEVDA